MFTRQDVWEIILWTKDCAQLGKRKFKDIVNYSQSQKYMNFCCDWLISKSRRDGPAMHPVKSSRINETCYICNFYSQLPLLNARRFSVVDESRAQLRAVASFSDAGRASEASENAPRFSAGCPRPNLHREGEQKTQPNQQQNHRSAGLSASEIPHCILFLKPGEVKLRRPKNARSIFRVF